MENTNCDYELVHLKGKKISGCIACLGCVRDNVCKVGVPTMLYGEGVRITAEMIPDVTRQAEVMQTAVDAGRLLGRRLRQGHDRMAVARAMQAKLMAMFGESA